MKDELLKGKQQEKGISLQFFENFRGFVQGRSGGGGSGRNCSSKQPVAKRLFWGFFGNQFKNKIGSVGPFTGIFGMI